MLPVVYTPQQVHEKGFPMSGYILSVDQGTTSSRAILFTAEGRVHKVAQEEFTQHFPNDGWVEHNPADLWDTVLRTARQVLEDAQVSATDLLAIGITNQRETTLVWDKQTGEPVYNAIVWQDRRTAEYCRQLSDQGHGDSVQEKPACCWTHTSPPPSCAGFWKKYPVPVQGLKPVNWHSVP